MITPSSDVVKFAPIAEAISAVEILPEEPRKPVKLNPRDIGRAPPKRVENWITGNGGLSGGPDMNTPKPETTILQELLLPAILQHLSLIQGKLKSRKHSKRPKRNELKKAREEAEKNKNLTEAARLKAIEEKARKDKEEAECKTKQKEKQMKEEPKRKAKTAEEKRKARELATKNTADAKELEECKKTGEG